MKSSANDKTLDISPRINRMLYGAFVLLAIYNAFTNDYGDAFSKMAIAMIFDPFNQAQPFNERPLYQRVWLFVHVGMVIFLAILALKGNA